MYWGAYLRQGTLCLPTTAKTEAWYYLEIEPVEVAPVADVNALEQAIIATIRRGNPTVPTPSRSNFPPPVVLKYAKVRSWRAFERTAEPFDIEERSGVFEIGWMKRRPEGRGWEEDHERKIRLPECLSLEEVAKRIVEIVIQRHEHGPDDDEE